MNQKPEDDLREYRMMFGLTLLQFFSSLAIIGIVLTVILQKIFY